MRDIAWKLFLSGYCWWEIGEFLGVSARKIEKVVRHRFAEQFPELAVQRFSAINKLRALATRSIWKGAKHA